MPDEPRHHDTTLRRLLTLQREVGAHVTAGLSPSELSERTLESLCTLLDWPYGTSWELGEDERTLRCTAAVVPSGGRLEANRVERPLEPGVGLIGRAWVAESPVWLADVPHGGDHAELSIAVGARSGVAFPLRDGKTCHGVLELVALEDRSADPELTTALTTVAEHVARTITRWHEREIARVSAFELLADAHKRYTTLSEAIPAVTYVAECDERSSYTYVSPRAQELLGYPAQDWLGESTLWEDRLHPEDRERALAEARRTHLEGESFDCEYRMIAADGRVVWVWEHDTILRDDDGRPLFKQGVMLDITSVRSAEAALRDSEARNRTVIAALDEGVLVQDATGTVVACNASATRIFGVSQAEMCGRGPGEEPFDVTFEDGTPLTPETAPSREVLATGHPAREVIVRVRRPDGTEILASMNAQPLVADRATRPSGAVCSFTDVTKRRRAEEEVAYLAYHDALTGLPNRAVLDQRLTDALTRARRNATEVALLYLDLDDFKLVNDSLGHAAGDELLVAVAARLGAVGRASDLLVRQGGDEFLLLLSDLESGDARAAAERVAAGLRETLAEPFAIGGAEFLVGASVGISLFPGDAEDAPSLLRHADAAMYHVKDHGRGDVAVYSGNPREPVSRLGLTSRLRRALDEGNFTLRYQPIRCLPGGGVFGFEALIRWRDGERGLVRPADFIPAAEDTGLIERIGEWVLRAVCAQAREWRAEGLSPHLAVNVSPRELRRPDFALRVGRVLAARGIPPDLLALELTESALRADTESILHELDAAGVHLAIDDFGMGYSSLDRLRRLPVKVLKIDRSFLTEVPEDEAATAIVTAMLELATALGMSTVAEGVETEAQLRFLAAAGCPLAQGHHLGRPMSAQAAGKLLRRQVGSETALSA